MGIPLEYLHGKYSVVFSVSGYLYLYKLTGNPQEWETIDSFHIRANSLLSHSGRWLYGVQRVCLLSLRSAMSPHRATVLIKLTISPLTKPHSVRHASRRNEFRSFEALCMNKL